MSARIIEGLHNESIKIFLIGKKLKKVIEKIAFLRYNISVILFYPRAY